MWNFEDINVGVILLYCCSIKIGTDRFYTRDAQAAPLLNIPYSFILLASIQEISFKITYRFLKSGENLNFKKCTFFTMSELMWTDKNWKSSRFKDTQDQATWELSHPNGGWNSEWPCLSTLLFMQFFVSANPSTTCCDSISRSVSDGTGASQTAAAAAAASFCCPSYENRLLASSRTELNAALGMYSSPYAAAAAASQNYANYFPYSTDPSAIYSTLVGSLHPHLMTGGRLGGFHPDRSRVFFLISLSHSANMSVSTSR